MVILNFMIQKVSILEEKIAVRRISLQKKINWFYDSDKKWQWWSVNYRTVMFHLQGLFSIEKILSSLLWNFWRHWNLVHQEEKMKFPVWELLNAYSAFYMIQRDFNFLLSCMNFKLWREVNPSEILLMTFLNGKFSLRDFVGEILIISLKINF